MAKLTKANKDSLGFGFDPSESQTHFWVELAPHQQVRIWERTKWMEDEPITDHRLTTLKLVIPMSKWEKICQVFRQEFNPRLKARGFGVGSWKYPTPIHRLLGKELMLLAWVVDDCDPSLIDTAIKNWQGLRPEERWWLYTMTNATSGGIDDNFGWRKAIRYALTENPILDAKKRQSLFFDANGEI